MHPAPQQVHGVCAAVLLLPHTLPLLCPAHEGGLAALLAPSIFCRGVQAVALCLTSFIVLHVKLGHPVIFQVARIRSTRRQHPCQYLVPSSVDLSLLLGAAVLTV